MHGRKSIPGEERMAAEVSCERQKDSIWTKSFIILFVLNFLMAMSQFMMNTLVPKYAYYLGCEASVVGLVTSTFAVTALAIRPIAGPAMDYFKKSRLLTLAYGTITLAIFICGFAQDITMLVVARLIHGLGVSFAAPLNLALASNYLPNRKMASGLGIFYLGSVIATAVGPAAGLAFADVIGYNAIFFICAGLMLLCFLLSLLLKNQESNRKAHFSIKIRQIIATEVIRPTLVLLFLSLAYSSSYFIAIYGAALGVKGIGLYFTASAACMVVVRPVAGRIADKCGVGRTVIPGLMIFGCSLVLLSFCRSLPMFLAAGALTALGYGFSQPIIQTLNMLLVSKERRGAAGNTNYMGIDLGILVGPTIAGLIVSTIKSHTGDEILGFSVMYRVMVIPVAIAITIYAFCRKRLYEKIKEKQDETD